MEKGRIKVNKKGGAELTKSDGKSVGVPKVFDLRKYIPEIGSVTFDCEYILDEKATPAKLIINGENVGLNNQIIEKKLVAENKKQIEEELNKKVEIERIANKKLIEYLQDDFVKIDQTFLPRDSCQILGGKEWQISNFNLKLNKASRFEGDKFQFFKTDKGKIIFQPRHKFESKLLTQLQEQTSVAAKLIFGKENENWSNQTFKTDWRMVVGLGGESVYETSMTLHHIYGIPYIPSSSIKGVVRSWIISEFFRKETEEPAEFWALQNEVFCKLFGTAKETNVRNVMGKDFRIKSPLKNKKGESTEHIGMITFFDAYPIEEPEIVPDIMNVHYPKYYSGNEAPTDTQSPIPILFLTVKNTGFQFIIGSKKEKLSSFEIGGKNIQHWLTEALTDHGIGAKTAVGYGYMSESK